MELAMTAPSASIYILQTTLVAEYGTMELRTPIHGVNRGGGYLARSIPLSRSTLLGFNAC
jgi:hypothetical protein